MENLKKFIKEDKKFAVACVIIVILLGVTIWLALSKQVPKTKNGNEVVASIKGYKVTADDLYAQLKEANGTDTLISLIDTYIASKEVTKLSKDDKEYVDNIVEYYKSMAEQYYGMELDDFLVQYIKLPGVTTEDEFRSYVEKDYKKSLALIKYVGSQIDEDEIKDYYDENYSETMTVKHILIEVSDDNDDEDALAEAEEIIAELNKVKDDEDELNETFKDLAFNHSSDGTYASEGLIEDFSKKDVVEEFWDASEELEDGEFTSEPVKTQYGYHVILKVSSNSKKKYKEVKEEIVRTLAEQRLQEDPTLQITAWDELRKKYKFKINDSDIKKQYNKTVKVETTTDETEEEE